MSSPPSGPSVFDGIPSLYDGIAKIYRWDWNAGNAGAFETQPLLANEFLSAFGGSAPGNKKTILLTHGWNDKLDHGADDEFMSRFARDLMLGRNANEIGSEYSVLAVDWYGEGLRRVLGSNPNLLPPIIDFISPYGAFDDALKSSVNGINIGKVLANELRAAGIGPAHLSNLMLIGHSNGAGFMGSLAKKLFQLTGEKVAEFAALDAPWLTRSYAETASAASAVHSLSNYYIPAGQSTEIKLAEPLPFFELQFGFGMPMFFADNITNFELNNDINHPDFPLAISHTQVPLRYSETADAGADAHPWGFKTTEFATGNNPSQLGWIWKETDQEGEFARVFDPIGFTANVLQQVRGIASGVAATIADTTVSVWDDSVRVATNIADSLEGVNVVLLNPIDTLSSRLPFIHGKANSPVTASIDADIPQDAVFLTFNLTVLDPGNNDTLLVAIGDDVLTEIDLASTLVSGGSQSQLWVGPYRGQRTTLTFHMPSDVTSSAEFHPSSCRWSRPPMRPALLTPRQVLRWPPTCS